MTFGQLPAKLFSSAAASGPTVWQGVGAARGEGAGAAAGRCVVWKGEGEREE